MAERSAFLNDWREESEVPYYLALADFSRCLIALLDVGNRKVLDAAFATIERLHTDGDKYVREDKNLYSRSYSA